MLKTVQRRATNATRDLILQVSENFYVDMNPEGLKRMLGSHIAYSDTSTLARSCVLSISKPSPDLFLVVRLEKVLQGDISECAEPYLREDKNKDKVTERIKRLKTKIVTQFFLTKGQSSRSSSLREAWTLSNAFGLDRDPPFWSYRWRWWRRHRRRH